MSIFKSKKSDKRCFMFNYFCKEATDCVAFSVSDDGVSAEWLDEAGEKHIFTSEETPDTLWQALEDVSERLGVYNWKAHRLYSSFVFSTDSSVFNAEAVFPNGKSFSANNMHGEPKGFAEALKEYKKLFAELAD